MTAVYNLLVAVLNDRHDRARRKRMLSWGADDSVFVRQARIEIASERIVSISTIFPQTDMLRAEVLQRAEALKVEYHKHTERI